MFEDLAIDEMAIGFTGHWKFKQFNASKPKKYHIKTFGIYIVTGFVSIFRYFGEVTSHNSEADPN